MWTATLLSLLLLVAASQASTPCKRRTQDTCFNGCVWCYNVDMCASTEIPSPCDALKVREPDGENGPQPWFIITLVVSGFCAVVILISVAGILTCGIAHCAHIADERALASARAAQQSSV